MTGSIIAFNPCSCCERKDMCSMCELTLYREGALKTDRWISVEERLPEEYGPVICCSEYSGYKEVQMLVYNPKYKLFNVSCDSIECAISVTHWMPLPEPPKKGGKG